MCEPPDGTDDLTVMARLLAENTALLQQVEGLKGDLALMEEVAQDVETQWRKAEARGDCEMGACCIGRVQVPLRRSAGRVLLPPVFSEKTGGNRTRPASYPTVTGRHLFRHEGVGY